MSFLLYICNIVSDPTSNIQMTSRGNPPINNRHYFPTSRASTSSNSSQISQQSSIQYGSSVMKIITRTWRIHSCNLQSQRITYTHDRRQFSQSLQQQSEQIKKLSKSYYTIKIYGRIFGAHALPSDNTILSIA